MMVQEHFGKPNVSRSWNVFQFDFILLMLLIFEQAFTSPAIVTVMGSGSEYMTGKTD